MKTLEYNKILDTLAECAGSEPGKNMCRKLRPSGNFEWINKSLTETDDALKRLIKNDRVSFGANKDIRGMLKALEIEQTLSIPELLSLSRLLTLVNELACYGETGDNEDPDSLTEFFDRLSPLPLLEREIGKCIISEDEVADDASAELKAIRRNRIATDAKIHSTLTKMVNGSHRTYLQDAVITMRDNRYCIPVKAEYKSQVPGMVHDRSATGSTLFVEPAAVVDMNNELKELDKRELEEIENILKELSRKAAIHKDELAENQKTVTMLDFIFAKAKYGLKLNAIMPHFNKDRYINLKKARHPLIDPGKIVPIDVRLGEDYDLLVITGPNTGGKTVSLKTVGLLALMGQSGLLIPAMDNSELSVFSEIYADIGDEQSIEQSLSTFSSHMNTIINILKHAGEDSLCLFDELGAGTDPTEGAALAISILNHLHERGIRTMATTHYSELKIYALSTDFVENACCEFDVESLRPTYRLLIGIPGKSNAFAISGKLGLPKEIIENAKTYISQEEESFETVISDLENKRLQLEKEQEKIDAYKDEIETLSNKLKAKEQELNDKKDKIIRDAREEAKDILQDAKDLADESIRAFQKQGTVMSIQTMEKKRSRLRENIKKQDASLTVRNEAKDKHKTISMADAQPGTDVHIISMNIDGVITVRPDSKGNVSVQCGIFSSKVNINDLYEISVEKQPENKKKGSINISRAASIPTEINVIGMNVADAVSRIDKYLDDACLCHMDQVRIVHGKGTGALRSGIHSYLNGNSIVRGYHLAAHGEGDAGVTVVEL